MGSAARFMLNGVTKAQACSFAMRSATRGTETRIRQNTEPEATRYEGRA
jgi:hypothetical protein